MSFVHDTLVGHFDPAALFPNVPLQALRPLDPRVVEGLLAHYHPEVAKHVTYTDGYVIAQWAPGGGWGEDIREFAYRLGAQEGCIAAESPYYVITSPPAAAQRQREAADACTAAEVMWRSVKTPPRAMGEATVGGRTGWTPPRPNKPQIAQRTLIPYLRWRAAGPNARGAPQTS